MLVKIGDYKRTLRAIKPCVVEGRKNTIESTAAPHASTSHEFTLGMLLKSVRRTGVENEGYVFALLLVLFSLQRESSRSGAPLFTGQSWSH